MAVLVKATVNVVEIESQTVGFTKHPPKTVASETVGYSFASPNVTMKSGKPVLRKAFVIWARLKYQWLERPSTLVH